MTRHRLRPLDTTRDNRGANRQPRRKPPPRATPPPRTWDDPAATWGDPNVSWDGTTIG